MRNEKLSLWLVLFVVFLDWMGIGLVYPMFSAMLFHPDCEFLAPETTENMRGWYLGILLAAMSVAQFFSGPILGALSDQKGRRPLFLFSLALGVGGYALCVWGVLLQSIVILICGRALIGVAAGNAAVVGAAVVDLSTPENKTKHFGLYSMVSGMGFAVGPFLGGKLSEFGFTVPFIVSAVAVLANLVLIFWLFKETHTVRKKGVVRFDEGFRKLKKAFQMTSFRGLFLTVFLFGFGWSFFYEFIPVTWIADYNFDAGRIGIFYAYGAAWYSLSAGVLIRPFVGRYRPLFILFCALFLLGVSVLTLLSRPTLGWIWIYLPVVNFLTSLIYPTFYSVASDWAKKDEQGEVLGIVQSIQSAGFAISPLAAGLLLGMSSHMPMWVGGIAILLATLILGIFLRGHIFAINDPHHPR